MIVLAWEDHELTRRCVASLVDEATQIIVVDNGSHEPHKTELRAVADDCRATLVRSDVNLGFAGGMNLGLRLASEEIVILSNNDLTVEKGSVARLVAALESPLVGAAFPATIDGGGRETTAAGHFLTLARAVSFALGLSIAFPRLGIVASPDQCDWLTGPFVAVRTQLLKDMGGVPNQSFFYSEDYRLCWALRQRGLGKRVVRDARVLHLDDQSAKKIWDAEIIAQHQTRELVRAAKDQYEPRLKKWILANSFLFGCKWRNWVRPSPQRQGCVRGAREALK
ncbi:glycosyltransferase [Mycobacterium sp. WMMD1722]|uniref:glycosyltransferase n=1 Tax=Mycobacterium sp. WMMD1722 TaxID=3404117 RepID=UPI003BF61B73